MTSNKQFSLIDVEQPEKIRQYQNGEGELHKVSASSVFASAYRIRYAACVALKVALVWECDSSTM
jgi:hypothetical protein